MTLDVASWALFFFFLNRVIKGSLCSGLVIVDLNQYLFSSILLPSSKWDYYLEYAKPSFKTNYGIFLV